VSYTLIGLIGVHKNHKIFSKELKTMYIIKTIVAFPMRNEQYCCSYCFQEGRPGLDHQTDLRFGPTFVSKE